MFNGRFSLCTLYSMNTIHTHSAVSVVIEVIHQFVQNNNFSPYVITQLSHIHIHMHTRIRLSENLPLIVLIVKKYMLCGVVILYESIFLEVIIKQIRMFHYIYLIVYIVNIILKRCVCFQKRDYYSPTKLI